MLPDDFALYERLSGLELLTYSGLLRGLGPDLVQARSTELLDVLDLTSAQDTLVVDYSTGMRKKVALAAALLHGPQVLFLDEPFESVDPVSTRTIRQVLERFAGAGGTVVFSSHVMEVVERVCDRVAIIADGRVVAEGTVDDLRGGRRLEDVFIDLVCYRRRGHNEGDDPSFTQPLMYDLIEQKRSVRKLYTEALIGRGDITVEEAERALQDYQQQLERVFRETREAATTSAEDATATPAQVKSGARSPRTSISREMLKRIANAYTDVPAGFTVHPKVGPQLQRRAAAITDGPIDWATGEMLAIGSLLAEGRPVRLSGQDTRRGTFTQRFAVIIDRVDGSEWTPVQELSDDGAKFYVYDSLLSEFAAMGFEYGYSVARPDALVVWEAQFGDFANGAQTIIDEFIASGELKWGQQSGIVLLLPHGYEGQGPDHSSGRIERFLSLSAQDSLRVAQPSTAASYFHLLRRHSLGEEHKPARRLHPQVHAAQQVGRLGTRGLPRGLVPAGPGRRHGRPGAGGAAAAVLREGRLGPAGRPRAGPRHPHRHRDRRAALPRTARGDPERDPALPEPGEPALGAGRTGQPGRVALHGRDPRRPPAAAAGAGVARRDVGAVGRVARAPPRGAALAPVRRLPLRTAHPEVYSTDRGIEELESRRGPEDVTLAWVAERLREFVDLHPDFEVPVERLATWLARLDDDDQDD